MPSPRSNGEREQRGLAATEAGIVRNLNGWPQSAPPSSWPKSFFRKRVQIPLVFLLLPLPSLQNLFEPLKCLLLPLEKILLFGQQGFGSLFLFFLVLNPGGVIFQSTLVLVLCGGCISRLPACCLARGVRCQQPKRRCPNEHDAEGPIVVPFHMFNACIGTGQLFMRIYKG